MKIYVADLSAPIGANVFKFNVHLHLGLYCVNENNYAKAHFAFFFNFSFCHSYITLMDFFVRVFSATNWFRIMTLCVHFQVGKVYCVNEN